MEEHQRRQQDAEAVSLVEDLLQRTHSPSATYRHFETLAYLKQCKFLAPYNAFLVMQQRKNPTVVMTADQWLERYGRKPKADVQPIVILRPFGPVSFVYDMNDTTGYDIPGLPPNLPTPELIRCIFPTDGWAPDLEERYARLRDEAHRQGANIVEARLEPALAGRASIDPDKMNGPKGAPLEGVSIEINTFHPIEVKLCGLVHELAHVYCHHLGSHRSLEEKEVEAEAVSYVFCYRRGFRPRSEEYLAGYLAHDRPMPVGFWDTVLTALKKVEALEVPREEKEGLPPLGFDACIESYRRERSYRIRLMGDKLRYEPRGGSTEILDVPAKAWHAFWTACNKCNVWAWNQYYQQKEVSDDIHWNFTLETPYRRLESSGDNAYPNHDGLMDTDGDTQNFHAFLKAISRLAGGRTFE